MENLGAVFAIHIFQLISGWPFADGGEKPAQLTGFAFFHVYFYFILLVAVQCFHGGGNGTRINAPIPIYLENLFVIYFLGEDYKFFTYQFARFYFPFSGGSNVGYVLETGEFVFFQIIIRLRVESGGYDVRVIFQHLVRVFAVAGN